MTEPTDPMARRRWVEDLAAEQRVRALMREPDYYSSPTKQALARQFFLEKHGAGAAPSVGAPLGPGDTPANPFGRRG